MRRLLCDGRAVYEIIVDGVETHGYREGQRNPGDEVTFSDERTAWLFLKRVADDYTELLALREILSAHDDRDDMHRYSDDDVLSLIAGCLVRGSLKLKLQPAGGIA